VPVSGATTATVTALTAGDGGFTATGTYPAPSGGTDVVVWTLPVTAGSGSGSWTAATPQGTGLAGPGAQAITALTANGAELTGVGFTTGAAGTGSSGTGQQPTLWQSPVRY
jgi:hypothetical protein